MDEALRRSLRGERGPEVLRERVRAGELSRSALYLCARLGWEPACEALSERPPPAARALELSRDFAAAGRGACVRAALACARAARVAEDPEPYAREVAVRLLAQVEAWVADPSERHRAVVADLDTGFLTWFEGSYWLDALVACVSEEDVLGRLAHVLETADRNLGARALAALRDLAPALLAAPRA